MIKFSKLDSSLNMNYKFFLTLLCIAPFAHSTNCTKPLFETKAYSNSKDISDISADQSKITSKDLFELSGNVEVSSFDYALSANQFNINKTENSAQGLGNINFQDSEIKILGKKVSLTKESEILNYEFDSPTFQIYKDNINGKAEKISGNKNIKSLTNASISSCDINNPDWLLNASTIKIDHINNKGYAENTQLNFFGIPIFYSPYLDWTLKGKGTGFLFPKISSYTNINGEKANQFNIPYFVNFASDRDILLSLNHLSDRGSSYEASYRQLIYPNKELDNGRWELKFNFLDNDKISNNDRWLIDNKLNLNFSDKSNLSLNNFRVSDKDYFRDIMLEGSSKERLISNLKLNSTIQDIDVNFLSESEQLVNSGVSQYTRSGQIELAKKIEIKNLHNPLNFSFLSTKFNHHDSTKTQGTRNLTQISHQHKSSINGVNLGAKASLVAADYNIKNGNDVDRFSYDVNLNSTINLEREISINNKPYIQTLVPKISYMYSPINNQSNYPNFDSEIMTQTYDNLFIGKKFTGFDRVVNKNAFALGVESEIIDDDSQDEFVTMYIGQKFNLNNTETDLSGSQISLDNSSNIFTGISFKLSDMNFSHNIEFNPRTNKSSRIESGINFSKGMNKFIDVSYLKDTEESLKLSTVFSPITNLEVAYSINRSLTQSLNNKQTLGLSYESCCWASRVVYEKELNESYAIEFIFKGLGSTSPNLREKLKNNIPNYHPSLYD